MIAPPAVTVKVVEPKVAPPDAVRVKVEEPLGVKDGGTKPGVTPEGSPTAPRVMDPGDPDLMFAVTEKVAVAPGARFALEGLTFKV